MQSTHTLLCEYVYDALDRLVNQHQPAAPAHQRFYCKSRLATEIHGTLGHTIIQHDDLLLAEQRREGSTTDTTLLATDLQRSVLNTLKQGVAPQPIAYSPYGHRPALGGLLSLLGFNGERPDPLTGHYLLGNGYRAFNPVLMRFNNPDNWSPFGEGGLNCYAYCAGDPINHTDPNGHTKFSIKMIAEVILGSRRARLRSILNRKTLKLPIGTGTDTNLTTSRIFELSRQHQKNSEVLGNFHNMKNKIIKKDFKNYKKQQLSNNTGTDNLRLSFNDQPPNAPLIKENSGAILEGVALSDDPYTALQTLRRDKLFPEFTEPYLKRVERKTIQLHDASLKKNHEIIDELLKANKSIRNNQ